jgi:hypothetical protein
VPAQQRHHLEHIVDRVRSELSLGRTMTAGIERERRDAVGSASAREVEVRLLCRPRPVQDHHTALGRT